MAITRKNFNEGNFKHRNLNPQTHPVLIFLRRNKNAGYTAKEISKYLKMKESTVRSFLYDAEKNKWVSHKAPYYIVNLRK